MTTRPDSSNPRRHPPRYLLLALSLFGFGFCSCQSLHPGPHPSTSADPQVPPASAASPAARQADPERGLSRTEPRTPSPTERAVRASLTDREAPSSVALATHTADPGGESWTGLHGAVCPVCTPPAALPPGAFAGYGALPRSEAALEYLCNGGDMPPNVLVKQDWSVHGLHAGDAVAHYDTLDGRVKVAASKPVCLYAPRFAAVRKVTGMLVHQQHQRGEFVDLPVGPAESGDAQLATTAVQPLQPLRHLGVHGAQRLIEKQRGAGLDNEQALAETLRSLQPYEDFLLIQRGEFDNTEKARLAIWLDAAAVWAEDLGVQVVIDNDTTIEAIGDVGLQSVFRYDLPPGKPRLRVVKVASSASAHPGDVVDFTLRFDNVGDQTVGNVTIIDHLVTRLEYVPDSQHCSLSADFFTQENDSQSLTLRWEIREPLPVGEGGVIRFQCRVR